MVLVVWAVGVPFGDAGDCVSVFAAGGGECYAVEADADDVGVVVDVVPGGDLVRVDEVDAFEVLLFSLPVASGEGEHGDEGEGEGEGFLHGGVSPFMGFSCWVVVLV